AFYKKRLNKCAALTCAKRINKREAQKINPCGLRADTLLIPAVAHCPQGAALCRTGQTSRTGRTDLVCRYNSAFTPELAVSGSVCKLNRAACDVANAGNGVFTAIFDASGKNRALERTVWFNGKADKKELLLKWRPVEFSTGFTKPVFEELTDLKYIDRIAYYIFCKVISDREREVIFSIGSDDGNKSWVNSTLCSAVNPVSRSLKADSEQFKLKLKRVKTPCW
ncbi:MAG: hypothetical protein IJC27_08255, partial [Lentisphaeria bacterium]|nr:hypothetical protein [Lentisphaeria bacterium]